MRAVVDAAVRFRSLVVAAAVVVMAIGVTQLRDAPVDVLPEFTPPYVEIQTEALGLSSTEVEDLITVPMEADVLNGVAGVAVIRSQSIPGLSSITLVFEPGTDLLGARQLVQERLTQARALPNVSKAPTMLQPLSSTSRVIMIGLSSDRLTPLERSVLARWTIRPRLMGVPGVANVAIWGQRDQQMQVRVDPETLREHDVSVHQVISTTGNAQLVSPLTFLRASTPGSGGFVDTPNQRLQIRSILPIGKPEQLSQVAVDESDGELRLGDVATVVEDHQPLIGDAIVNDGPGLLLAVEKLPGANTLDVTRGVESALEALRPGLAGMEIDSSIFRPATFIETAMDNVALALLGAVVLLALSLAAFLLDWRSVAVGLIAVPLSALTAALVLDLRGETMNAMVLAGLVTALGVMVDDAVVGVEAVRRRLRERRPGDGSASVASTVIAASLEVRRPLAYATAIVLLAVLPVFAMDGRPGAFFEPLAVSYGLAVLASLLVAVTVTPALAAFLYSSSRLRHRESPLARRAGAMYAGSLGRVLRAPKRAVLSGLVLGLVGVAAIPLLQLKPIPSFEERHLLVQLAAVPGTSGEEMTRIASRAGRELRTLRGVSNVGAHVGRAVTSDRIAHVNVSELWVSLDPGADHDATAARIREVVDGYPGLSNDVLTYSAQRIREVGAVDDGVNDPTMDRGLDVLTGADEQLVVRVYGQERDILRRKADELRAVLGGVDGVVDPRVKLQPEEPTLEVEVNLQAARRVGIAPGDVRRQAAILVQGIEAGALFEDQKIFDVIVRGEPQAGHSLSSLRNLLIDVPDGEHTRLGDVADVRITPVPTVIRREAVSRYVDVAADVSGRDVGAVVADVERGLEGVDFPLEYHAEVVSDHVARESDRDHLLAVVGATVIGIFLLLQVALGSWRLAALFTVALPGALTGGVLAAWVAGGTASLGSLLGLLLVLGIAVRNGILFVDGLRRHQETSDGVPQRELVLRAAGERLVPSLTTAFAVGLALVPVLVLGSTAGLEILQPMAVVVLGGMVTATVVPLFVLPVLFLRSRAQPATEPAISRPQPSPA